VFVLIRQCRAIESIASKTDVGRTSEQGDHISRDLLCFAYFRLICQLHFFFLIGVAILTNFANVRAQDLNEGETSPCTT